MCSVGILLDSLGYLPYKVTRASQTTKRGYLAPSPQVCISTKRGNTRLWKQNPMCYMFFLLWEGGEGRPAVILTPTTSHIFAQEELGHAVCNQQPQPAFTATKATAKCKTPPVWLERGFGVPLPHSPNPETTGKREKEIKKQQQTP